MSYKRFTQNEMDIANTTSIIEVVQRCGLTITKISDDAYSTE